MHDISNRILRPINGFLVVVFAKIIIDCVIYYITHWNYPKVIFWQSVIVFFFLFYRYLKKHKIQKKNSESINHLDYTLFKAIQFKVYNSIFVDFIKNNQFLLVLLFLSNARAIDIIQKIREIFFSNLDSIIFDNEKVLQTLLPIVIKLREYPDLINFLYSFYFCIIVYIFLNQIDFQTKNDCLQKERKMPRSQLIKDIVENNISLENALLRLKVITFSLNNLQLQNWIDNEIRGYTQDDIIPEYRKNISYTIRYSGLNGNFQISSAPLSETFFTEEVKSILRRRYITDGIGTIEGNMSMESVYDLIEFAPMVLTASNSRIQCVQLEQVINKSTLEHVVSNLKLNLINLLLDLEKNFGNLDKLDIDVNDITSEELESVNNNIVQKIYYDGKSKVI